MIPGSESLADVTMNVAGTLGVHIIAGKLFYR